MKEKENPGVSLLPDQEDFSAVARERGNEHQSARDTKLVITEKIGEPARQNTRQSQRLSHASKAARSYDRDCKLEETEVSDTLSTDRDEATKKLAEPGRP